MTAELVELRCERRHLVGRLEPGRRLVELKCRNCSYHARRLVTHWFDAETGALVTAPGREEAAPAIQPGRRCGEEGRVSG